MTFGMIVRLPVSVAFGTDEEFDLRVKLEKELADALGESQAGECAGGEIDTSHINLRLDGIVEPNAALKMVRLVLIRNSLLSHAEILLETRNEADPDDCDRQVLWSPSHAQAVPIR